MAKFKTDPVSQADLIEFLNDHSDFSFEIQVLHALINRGFTCEHGGTYDDPSTNKPREFDIRATKVFGKRFLRLAVECKNLRPHFPLLISCLPRRDDESFHEIVYSANPETNPIDESAEPYGIAMQPTSKSIRLTSEHTIYKPGDAVGKSSEQVGRKMNNDITSGDSGVYEKWAQALSSANDLTYLACSDGSERTGNVALSAVFPIVVVPNGRLWQTQYDGEGNRIADPEQVARCSYFVGRNYYHRSPSGGDELALSHLEFVTLDGLLQFVDDLCGDDNKIDQTFPCDHVGDMLRHG